MKISKSLIIVGISTSLFLIAWQFMFIPELKNGIEIFDTDVELIGMNAAIQFIDDPLPEHIPSLNYVNYNILNSDYDYLEIQVEVLTDDIFTGETIWHSEKTYDVNKFERTHYNSEKYFEFPINTEQKNYEFHHPIMINDATFVFERTETIQDLEVYVFSCMVPPFDVSIQHQQISEKIFGTTKCTAWVEPKTGIQIKFHKSWHSYVDTDNGEIVTQDGFMTVSDYSTQIFAEIAKKQIQLFYFYDIIIPIFSVFTASGIVTTIFINQSLKTRTKEFVDYKDKKIEDTFYDELPNYLATLDKEFRVVNANKKILDEIGYSKDEVIGKSAYDFIIEEEHEELKKALADLRNGEYYEMPLHIKRKDGSFVHILWNSIIIYDEDKNYNGHYSIGFDLTEIDELRDKLIKKEKMSVVGELATNLAHDIKNPLASIKNSLDIIQRKTTDSISLKESQRTNLAIKRIEHQVDLVLNYVKLQPLQTEDTTVLTILKQSLDLMQIPENITMVIPEKDFDVKWDETQISVAFTNIIQNAIQAIGNDEGNITIRFSEEGEKIIIEIENSGPNIPEKDLEKIFDLLYTTKMEGTGLGLSGCKNIIESHKGVISVSNNPVKFTMEIPRIQ